MTEDEEFQALEQRLNFKPEQGKSFYLKQTEALKLALECIEAWDRGGNASDYWRDRFDAITAIREALADSALDRMAENAREIGLDYGPIVERVEDSIGMGNGAWDMVEPKELAKAFHEALAEQPSKPWVGLTDEEVTAVWRENEPSPHLFARAIEAKLREKNSP